MPKITRKETTSTEKTQCCEDHLNAARAGHTQCLQDLAEAGRFLPLGSPDRASAGELRRLEVWQAAITTCRVGHGPTLSWLFASGWPSSIDAALTWQTRDTVDLREVMEWSDLVEKDSLLSEVCDLKNSFLLELDLYRCAMRKATPECLEALLEAGCRSVWICRLAALEGNAAFLALAANRGCPCDLTALKFAAGSGDLSLLEAAHSALLLPNGALHSSKEELNKAVSLDISRAAWLAVSRGHAACLKALLGRFGKWVTCWVSFSTADSGDLNCLQTLHRAGCLHVKTAAYGAIRGAHLECLQYVLDLDPGLVHQDLLTRVVWWSEAGPEAQVAFLEFLQHRGCQWSSDGQEMVEAVGSPEVLRYCLERVPVRPWDEAMCSSVFKGSLECMQVLYDAGYERHRSREASKHPALATLNYGEALSRHTVRACVLLALSRSGVPDTHLLNIEKAVWGGEEMLRYVRELGVPFAIRTTYRAGKVGNVGALRYALKNGAPCGATTFEAVIAFSCRPSQDDTKLCPDWMECLRCLHEHARAAGFPK
eukprot:jgi/Botrbrau1/1522/Bobra.0107s0010.1